MRLQELATKERVRHDEAAEKHVRVFLQSSFYILEGKWQWEMETSAVFCSDVMVTLQEDFIGTKAIFHPDDVALLKAMLLPDARLSSLRFRIITTYGEVKTVAGENIVVVEDRQTAEAWQQRSWQNVVEEQERKTTGAHLQILKEISDKTSRYSSTGTWYYNAATHQAWYSDFVYFLHGLPPQSLNAHLHTFHPFIHPEDKALVVEYTDKAYGEKTPLHLTYRIVVAGKEKWVAYKSFWFYGGKGEAILGGIFQDVTEQKTAEKEAESYKNLVQFQRQQLLYDEQQVSFGHWQVNLLTRKTTYSDQYYRIFGLKPQSLLSNINAFLNYIHPDDREKVEAMHRQIIYEHSIPDLEYRIIRNDGQTRYLLQKAKLVMAEDELVMTGIIQDITVQRLLEKKVANLNESLQIKQWLAQQSDEQSGIFSWVLDLEEGGISWSDSFYRFAGLTKVQPGNVTEKTLFSLVHPHEQKTFRSHWNQAIQKREDTVFDLRLLVRGVVQFTQAVFRFYQLNGKDYFIGTLKNTTAEQVLQQQLSQRVQQAENITENTFNRIIITDLHNTILLWNRAAEETYGRKRSEVIGQNFFDVFPHMKTEEEMQLFQRVQKGEKVVQEGLLSVMGHGYYNLYLVPIYQGNTVSGILHIIQDVTSEVRLRNSLSERLQLIESLVQASVDRIIALDRNLNYLYWNRSAEKYYGMPKENVLGKNILEVFPALVNDPSYNEIRRALRGETVHIPLNAEAEAYFETYLIPIKDKRGDVISLLWMTHDLSNEYTLQQQQRKALQVLSSVNAVFMEIDGEFRFQFLNETAERYLAKSHADLLGKVMWEAFPEPEGTPGRQAIVKGVTENQAAEIEYFSSVFQKWVYLSVIPTDGGILLFFYDRQDIKDAQEQLQAEHRRLTEAQAVGRVGSFEWTVGSAVCYWSDELYRIHGLAPRSEAITMDNMDRFIYPDDMAELQQLRAASLQKGGNYKLVHRIVRSDGEVRWVNLKWECIAGEGGAVTRVTGLVQDITEQVQAEEAIRESNQLLAQVMDASPDFIMVFNLLTNKVEYVNRSGYKGNEERYRETLSIDYETLLRRTHPDDREGLRRFIDRFRTAADGDVFTFEYRVVDQGQEIWYCSRGKVFKRNQQGQPTHYISNVQDITEHKKIESQLEEQSHYLRRITETVPDMMSVMELSTRKIHFLNKATFVAHGFDPDQMLQKGKEELAAMVHAADRQHLNLFYRQLRKAPDDAVVTAEYRAMDLSGEWKWLLVRGKVFQRDAGGKVTHILNAIENITARKATEQEIIRLKDEVAQSATDKYYTIFNSIDDGFCVIELIYDEQGRAVDFRWLEINPAYEKHTGIQNPTGRLGSELVPGTESYWFNNYDRVVKTGEPLRLENWHQPTERWYHIFVSRIGGEDSRQLAIVYNDATERKKAMDALRESEERFRNLVESCAQIVWEMSAEGEVVTDSPTWRAYTGQTFDEWKGFGWMNAIHPDDRAYAEQLWREMIAARQNINAQCRLKHAASNSYRWTNVLAAPLLDETGHVIKWTGMHLDIQLQKEAEEQLKNFTLMLEQQVAERTHDLKEKNRFIEQIAATTPDLITIHEAATRRILYTNHKDFWKELYSNDETYQQAEEKRAIALTHPEDSEKMKAFLQAHRLLNDGEVKEVELRMKGDKWIRIRSMIFRRDGQGNAGEIISFTSDITEAKKAELEIKKNLAILQQAEDLAQMGSWEYEVATQQFRWSEGMYRLFGLPQGTRVGPETYLDFALEEDRSVAKRIVKNLKKGQQPFEETLRIQRADEVRLLKVKGTLEQDAKGKTHRILGVDVDITDIREAEQKVAESRNLLEQTALATPDAITIYDLVKKQPVYLNNCLAEWVGQPSEKLVTMGIDGRLQLIHPEDRLRLLHFNEKMKAAKDGELLTIEYRIYGKEEKLLWIRNRSKVFQRNAEGRVTHILSVLQDVTEAKAAERVQKALHTSLEKKAQQLEAANEEITSFAFVASHDLKEPLRKIHTFNSQLLTQEENLSESGRKALEKMSGSVQRLNLLINDVLTLTRVHVENEKPVPVDMNVLLEKLKQEMEEKWKGAVIQSGPLPRILGAENQLFYLLKNLISNGIKFQEKGNQPKITIEARKEDAFQQIIIRDNGIGIPAEYHKKIFEMFKRLHSRTEYEGTGMGLAVCKKIMEKHGGKITVESEPGQGTSFICWFPLALSTTESPASSPEQ